MAPPRKCEMWEKPAGSRNVNQLREDGVQIIDPMEGWLSCRTKGVGRMADPDDIRQAINAALKQLTD